MQKTKFFAPWLPFSSFFSAIIMVNTPKCRIPKNFFFLFQKETNSYTIKISAPFQIIQWLFCQQKYFTKKLSMQPGRNFDTYDFFSSNKNNFCAIFRDNENQYLFCAHKHKLWFLFLTKTFSLIRYPFLLMSCNTCSLSAYFEKCFSLTFLLRTLFIQKVMRLFWEQHPPKTSSFLNCC